MKWRAPLVRMLDDYMKGAQIHKSISLLRPYYQLPRHEQMRLQQDRLVNLLKYAVREVPYYGMLLRSVGAVNSAGDIDLTCFRDIPPLTRDIIREQGDALRSSDISRRRWYPNSTGGSTGEPLRFIQDQNYRNFAGATDYLEQERIGVRLGERIVELWGSQQEIISGTYGWRAKLGGYLRDIHYLNCFRMSQEDLQAYVSFIQSKPPALLLAYADAIYELSRYMNAHNHKIPGVRAIITGAGTLLPLMREEIERAFCCPVFNRYGSREMSSMAFDHQSHEFLVVNSYTHLIEVVNQAGNPCRPGEEGEILVTSLTNQVMPFIRYRIGDTAVVKETSRSPVASVVSLSGVTGRVVDSLIRRDGTIVSPLFFIHFIGVVHNSGWARKVQVVQPGYDRVVVKLLLAQAPPEGALPQLEGSLKKGMGEDCQIEFEFVDDLPPSTSGKYRYVCSQVKH